MTLWIVIPPGHGISLYCKTRQSAMEFVFALGGPSVGQWARPPGTTSVWQAGAWQIRPALSGDE